MDEDGSCLVIFHRACTDGFCAAWIAHKVFPEAQFYAAYHGQDPPDVTGKNVFILDFSYKRDLLLKMKERAKSLLVLDHHKTAATELSNLPFCVFDMKKSGASLSWDYFKDKIKSQMPWLVSYVEDRDLGKWELPLSHEINAAIDSYPFEFKVWDALDRIYPANSILESPLVVEGKSILRFQERLVDVIVQHARTVELDGHKIKAANTSCIFSEVAKRLSQDQPFGLAWYLREDGKYIYSLRSKENGIDVGQIAKSHGGGGHPHSAGFETERLVLKDVN